MIELEWRGLRVKFDSMGDGAVTVRIGDFIDEAVNTRARIFADAIQACGFDGLVEAAAGYHTVTVYYDMYELYRGLDRLAGRFTGLEAAELGSLQDAVCYVLAKLWEGLADGSEAEGRLVEIPVVYGGEYGPDLLEAKALCGLDADTFIRLHSGAEYRVYMIGFVPGFPYLGGLDDRLALPRRSTPRVSVPAGSVAIGGGQTGIYPLAVPGGWHIIGRTPLELFRPDEQPPSLLRAGDRVRFVPVEHSSASGRREQL